MQYTVFRTQKKNHAIYNFTRYRITNQHKKYLQQYKKNSNIKMFDELLTFESSKSIFNIFLIYVFYHLTIANIVSY